MIIISPTTASAMSPHTSRASWVMFVQTVMPGGSIGPSLIEPIAGPRISSRLSEIARNNAYETILIGLVETPAPDQAAQAIREQFAGKHLHHDWHEPTADLIAYIQHHAQTPIKQLLAQTHPGGLSTETVGVEELAKILKVSETTIGRMVKANQIPFMRWGRVLRFVPAEVIASLQHRGDGRR